MLQTSQNFFCAHRRRTSAPDQSYSQDMLLHDQRSLTSAVSTVLSLHRRRCGKVPAAPYVLGHSLTTPCKARTSRDTGKETPRGPPAKPPPPWSQSLAETYLRRITCLQRNLPVGRGASSRDTRRPMPGVLRSGLLVARRPSRGLGLSREVEFSASDPARALDVPRPAGAFRGCRHLCGGSPGGDPHPRAPCGRAGSWSRETERAAEAPRGRAGLGQ